MKNDLFHRIEKSRASKQMFSSHASNKIRLLVLRGAAVKCSVSQRGRCSRRTNFTFVKLLRRATTRLDRDFRMFVQFGFFLSPLYTYLKAFVIFNQHLYLCSIVDFNFFCVRIEEHFLILDLYRMIGIWLYRPFII